MPTISKEGIEIPDCYNITHAYDDVYYVSNRLTDSTYEVDMVLHTCTCPHWAIRLKKSKAMCKHQEWVQWWGAWNK